MICNVAGSDALVSVAERSSVKTPPSPETLRAVECLPSPSQLLYTTPPIYSYEQVGQ